MKFTAIALLVATALAAGCTATGDPGGSTTAPPSNGETATSSATATQPGPGAGYAVCRVADPGDGSDEITFSDGTAASGLEAALVGMRGHAAAWGDIDQDGQVDLFVGTFATASEDVYHQRGATGPAPDHLLLGGDGGFEIFGGFPEQYGRTSGAALVDLDGDGDLDLVASRNVTGREGGVPTAVFENTAEGFIERTTGIDAGMGGRSVGVLDYDGDDLLDLVIVEDHYRGGSSRIFRNLGDFAFQDVGMSIGFPADVHGLGVATGDLNNDGYTDLFVAGSNRLFAGTGSGLVEVPDAVGEWETFGPEDDVSGAAIADVNRDGWLDLVVGHHFNSTVDRGSSVPVRLYLNQTGESGGKIELRDVTEAAGLVGLPTKAPHVELADIDNDGWPDIVTSASAGDGAAPAIFEHLGVEDGIPSFSAPQGMGSPQYWVTAPTADVDGDGRLDLLAVEWEPALPSVLFMNQTASGNWLQVSVTDPVGGIGTRVNVYEEGGGGDEAALIGAREVTATLGYTAGVEAVAHFGLGETAAVDVVVVPPGGAAAATLRGVPANSQISVGGEC